MTAGATGLARMALGAVLAALVATGGAGVQERQAPQVLEPGASCTSSGCHDRLLSGDTVHSPASDSCEICHAQEGNRHSFSYPFTGTELCYACHESVTDGEHVHEPLRDPEAACTACHEPHSASGKSLLRAEASGDLCLRCHAQVAAGGMFHDFEGIGGCLVCHEPHSSDSAAFLQSEPPGLCYKCHAELQRAVEQASAVHGPLSVGCTPCHDPHRQLAGKGIASGGAAFCVDCHQHFADTLSLVRERHPGQLEGDGCLRCHEPHAGMRDLLLRGPSLALCLHCHDKEVRLSDEGTLESLAALREGGLSLHGPLAQQRCTGCHEPHANARFRFLAAGYPAGFYSPYSTEAYAVCFACHPESLAAQRHTSEATEFRNGEMNLHYVHVNKQKKGRTC
ncbi:MAG: cytochrome c3 family protein, partial [Planctomycetota bacterium]